MSAAATNPPDRSAGKAGERPAVERPGKFILRKLHSLSGVVPVGVFLVLHLWTSSSALEGQASFDAANKDARGPYQTVLQIGLVLVPLFFHALYGVKIALEGRQNTNAYPYARNWMYAAQRITGIGALAFIVWHLSEYWVPRVSGAMAPEAFYPALCENLSATRFGIPLAALGYVFGIAACVFHFANGMWGFCFSWGITVSRRAQRLSATVFGLCGLLLFLLGANTAIYFATGSRVAIFGVPSGSASAQLVRTCGDLHPPAGEPGLPLPCRAGSAATARQAMKPSARVATFSDGGKVRRVAVVGGGVAGLMTALKLAESGVPVDLFSSIPVRRSTSVAAQDGIHAALDPRSADGDSPQAHLDDALSEGEFLAHQPPVLGMVEAAPQIVNLFDRMGVPLQRTAEGQIELRASIGASFPRSASAGATTGQELLYALDEQVRRLGHQLVISNRGLSLPGERMVRCLEYWEFLRLVRDDAGICIGLVAQDLRAMTIKALPFDAVVLATGGCSSLFGKSNPSTSSTGSAASSVFQQGAIFANPEFFQFTPTAIPGADKLHCVADGARSQGGRLWVPKDEKEARSAREVPERDRDYFLERACPSGNMVASDRAARAIFRLCHLEERGVYDARSGKNEPVVYLDLSHLDPALLRRRLGRAFGIYQRVSAVDPTHEPLKVRPSAIASLGGLWVDYERDARGAPVAHSPRNHATSIPGLYAVGEVEYQYHGAQRLADDALLSSAYGASLCAAGVACYRASMARSAFDLPQSLFDKEEKRATGEYEALLGQSQDDENGENPYCLRDELAELMERDCFIERDNAVLDQALDKLSAIADRAGRVKVLDSGARVNQGAPFVRGLSHTLVLARLVLEASRARNESRGGHFKPQFEARNDASWLRTTLASHAEGAPRFIREFDYACAGKSIHVSDDVDTSLLPVRPRKEP